MREEYRGAILGGIAGGIGATILLYIIRGKFALEYLITFTKPIRALLKRVVIFTKLKYL